MNSFDFFDTLFTRLVAKPTGIFDLVEEMLGMPGFAGARKQAEVEAGRIMPQRQVTLDEIYSRLALPDADRLRAIALEQRLEEELLVPIHSNLRQVADGDLVVSDMYLPPEPLARVLGKHLEPGIRPKLIVSSEVGHRKSDGSLWKHILREQPPIDLHLGDNRKSDVRIPGSLGIAAQHFADAELNRHEAEYARCGLDGNLIAGISRATRLSRLPSSDRFEAARELRTTFASVIAPALVAFVEHVLADCQRQQTTTILFMARDGQLLHLIAEKLIEARGLPLQARYVAASRRALHVPGFTSVKQAAPWLLDDAGDILIKDVASRAEIDEAILVAACAEVGLDVASGQVAGAARRQLQLALGHPRVADAMRRRADERWQAAYQYYRQCGAVPGARVAIVDVGWGGRMQASLRAMLDKAGGDPVRLIGYYLCLSQKARSSTFDELSGYLFDPERDAGPCFVDPYRPVIEASLLADHGTTLSFRLAEGTAEPIWDVDPPAETRHLVEAQQAVVLRFVDLMLSAERSTGHRITWPAATVKHTLRTMLEFPRAADARAYANHQLSIQQVEGKRSDIIARSFSLSALFGRNRLGMWPEGSLAAHGQRKMLPILALARWLHARRSARQRRAGAKRAPPSATALDAAA